MTCCMGGNADLSTDRPFRCTYGAKMFRSWVDFRAHSATAAGEASEGIPARIGLANSLSNEEADESRTFGRIQTTIL